MGLDLITFRAGADAATPRRQGQRHPPGPDHLLLRHGADRRAPAFRSSTACATCATASRTRASAKSSTSMIEDMEGGKMLSQCMAAVPAGVRSGVRQPDPRRRADRARCPRCSRAWRNALQVAGRARVADQAAADLSRPWCSSWCWRVLVFLLTYLVPQVVGAAEDHGARAADADPRADRAVGLRRALLVDRASALPDRRRRSALVVDGQRQRQRARYLWDYAKLRMPVIGPILQKIILARFANFFALMYRSGITVLDAITHQRGHRRQPRDRRRPAARRAADQRGRSADRGLPEPRHVSRRW